MEGFVWSDPPHMIKDETGFAKIIQLSRENSHDEKQRKEWWAHLGGGVVARNLRKLSLEPVRGATLRFIVDEKRLRAGLRAPKIARKTIVQEGRGRHGLALLPAEKSCSKSKMLGKCFQDTRPGFALVLQNLASCAKHTLGTSSTALSKGGQVLHETFIRASFRKYLSGKNRPSYSSRNSSRNRSDFRQTPNMWSQYLLLAAS